MRTGQSTPVRRIVSKILKVIAPVRRRHPHSQAAAPSPGAASHRTRRPCFWAPPGTTPPLHSGTLLLPACGMIEAWAQDGCACISTSTLVVPHGLWDEQRSRHSTLAVGKLWAPCHGLQHSGEQIVGTFSTSISWSSKSKRCRTRVSRSWGKGASCSRRTSTTSWMRRACRARLSLVVHLLGDVWVRHLKVLEGRNWAPVSIYPDGDEELMYTGRRTAKSGGRLKILICSARAPSVRKRAGTWWTAPALFRTCEAAATGHARLFD